jgi:hypothetical protein
MANHKICWTRCTRQVFRQVINRATVVEFLRSRSYWLLAGPAVFRSPVSLVCLSPSPYSTTNLVTELAMTRIKSLVTIAVIGTISLLAFCHTDCVVTRSGGDLMWNSNADEAYLFWEISLGYRMSYLEYPLQVFREYFGVGREPDDKPSSMAIWRITSTGPKLCLGHIT